MTINALFRLIAFDFRLYLRDWMTVFWMLVYPVMMLLLFGSIFGQEVDESGRKFIEMFVPALCAMNVLSISLFTLSINMITYRDTGVLRRFRVSPVKVWTVLVSQSVQGLLLVFAGAVEIILVAKLVWDIPIDPASAAALFGALLLGCVAFFGLGFALSGLSSSAKSASGLAMVIFFPMMFLSGIAMPIEVMPSIMQSISNWIPMTYYVDITQGLWHGVGIDSLGLETAVIGGFAVVSIVAALVMFKWEK